MSAVPAQLRAACRRLTESAADLPNPPDGWYDRVDELFAGLDEVIRGTGLGEAESILREPAIREAIPAIHRVRALWEREREARLARHVLASPDPHAELTRHVAQELPVTTMHGPEFARIARELRACVVVGSGALPTTTTLLLQLTDLPITCLDVDDECSHLGQQVLLASRSRPAAGFVVADASTHDMSSWDAVLVTVLAGVDWNQTDAGVSRKRMIRRLIQRVRPGTTILLRSAHALGGLVYPVVDEADLAGCRVHTLPAPTVGRSSLIVAVKTPGRA